MRERKNPLMFHGLAELKKNHIKMVTCFVCGISQPSTDVSSRIWVIGLYSKNRDGIAICDDCRSDRQGINIEQVKANLEKLKYRDSSIPIAIIEKLNRFIDGDNNVLEETLEKN
jgi:hypothetical protein